MPKDYSGENKAKMLAKMAKDMSWENDPDYKRFMGDINNKVGSYKGLIEFAQNNRDELKDALDWGGSDYFNMYVENELKKICEWEYDYNFIYRMKKYSPQAWKDIVEKSSQIVKDNLNGITSGIDKVEPVKPVQPSRPVPNKFPERERDEQPVKRRDEHGKTFDDYVKEAQEDEKLNSSRTIESGYDSDKLWEIADRYNTSKPLSGDWDTETQHELNAISKELGVSKEEAKQIMIRELGFDEDMFDGINCSCKPIKSSKSINTVKDSLEGNFWTRSKDFEEDVNSFGWDVEEMNSEYAVISNDYGSQYEIRFNSNGDGASLTVRDIIPLMLEDEDDDMIDSSCKLIKSDLSPFIKTCIELTGNPDIQTETYPNRKFYRVTGTEEELSKIRHYYGHGSQFKIMDPYDDDFGKDRLIIPYSEVEEKENSLTNSRKPLKSSGKRFKVGDRVVDNYDDRYPQGTIIKLGNGGPGEWGDYLVKLDKKMDGQYTYWYEDKYLDAEEGFVPHGYSERELEDIEYYHKKEDYDDEPHTLPPDADDDDYDYGDWESGKPQYSSRKIQSGRYDEVDPAAVEDLYLTIINDGDMYNGIIRATVENLKKHNRRGQYDENKAIISWMRVTDEGAKRYDKKFGSGMGSVTMFSPATRKEVAKRLMEYYDDNVRGGEDF